MPYQLMPLIAGVIALPEWMKGLIGGIFATLVGFSFTVWWDSHKYRRDQGQRDEAVLTAAREELLSNIDLLKRNQFLLQQELAVIDERKSVVDPLSPLKSGAWELLRTNMPRKLIREVNTFNKIKEADQAANEVNETIRSRENYRIHNGAMSNFADRMKSYDQILLEKQKRSLEALEELKSQL